MSDRERGEHRRRRDSRRRDSRRRDRDRDHKRRDSRDRDRDRHQSHHDDVYAYEDGKHHASNDGHGHGHSGGGGDHFGHSTDEEWHDLNRGRQDRCEICPDAPYSFCFFRCCCAVCAVCGHEGMGCSCLLAYFCSCCLYALCCWNPRHAYGMHDVRTPDGLCCPSAPEICMWRCCCPCSTVFGHEGCSCHFIVMSVIWFCLEIPLLIFCSQGTDEGVVRGITFITF